MKKNLKHLLALCLTLALVFSLAACGQKADETPNDAQNDQQTEQEEFAPASYSIAALKGHGYGSCEADEGQREWRNDWQ